MVAVLFMHLIIKAINAGQGGCLVVASEHDYSRRADALQAEHITDSFNRVVASIDVVAQEDNARLALVRN